MRGDRIWAKPARITAARPDRADRQALVSRPTLCPNASVLAHFANSSVGHFRAWSSSRSRTGPTAPTQRYARCRGPGIVCVENSTLIGAQSERSRRQRSRTEALNVWLARSFDRSGLSVGFRAMFAEGVGDQLRGP